jgi:hypothetical protein
MPNARSVTGSRRVIAAKMVSSPTIKYGCDTYNQAGWFKNADL